MFSEGSAWRRKMSNGVACWRRRENFRYPWENFNPNLTWNWSRPEWLEIEGVQHSSRVLFRKTLLQQHTFGKWLERSLLNSRKSFTSLSLHLQSTAKLVAWWARWDTVYVHIWNLHINFILPHDSSLSRHSCQISWIITDHRGRDLLAASRFQEKKEHLAGSRR